MRYQNGDIYEGYWRNGMKDGQGKLIEGGLVRYGKWIRGQYIENLY